MGEKNSKIKKIKIEIKEKNQMDIKLFENDNDSFLFKGLQIYKIHNICSICGNHKFTKEQIDLLSDSTLTHEKFKLYFPNLDFIHEYICLNPKCKKEYFKTARFKSFINLNFYWNYEDENYFGLNNKLNQKIST